MSKNTNLSFLTDYITADITNGRIGINNASPAYSFDVTGVARTSTSTYLATASGNVGIGTSSPTRLLDVSAAGTAYIRTSDTTNSVNVDMLSASSGGWIGTQSNHSFQLQTNNTERMRITSGGNILMGTSTDNGERLYVSGAIRATGTMAANILSVNSAVYTYNVQQAYYGQNFVFTPPNALNSGSDNSLMRMYMIWVWGANGATEAGCRVWMIAMNGGGTAHTVSQLLGRDANGVTSLSIARTSASEITISSNNNAFIKYVSIMQLMTYANG